MNKTNPNFPAATAAPAEMPPRALRRSNLWWWFVAAFVLQLGAWTAWFVIAGSNKVAEVPLAGQAHR